MKKIAIYLLPLLFAIPLKAQNADPAKAQTAELRGENRSLQMTKLQALRLPANIDDICFFDGRLHISSGGMLFGVSVNNGKLGFPEADTALTSIDAQMTYAVRHNATGTFYYTRKDSKGRSYLYEYYEKKPGKYDTRRVKPYGFSYTIEHPVFSSDGRAMVFASDCPIGFGGSDLWYSEWHNDQWQYPQNLGHRINGDGDETMPAIYGDFLVFASTSRSDSRGGSDLYASRLVALEQTGDTVMMYPIGRSPLQSLEAPFCTVGDDFGFAVGDGGYGWWISRSVDSIDAIHSFYGRMDCIKLTGVVGDIAGNVLADAEITLVADGRQAIKTRTDRLGRYCLFVQPDVEYLLKCYAAEHFSFSQKISYSRTKEDLLYGSERYNITLLAFEIGSAYNYDDLFGSPVSSELSASGRNRVDQMATFLLENSNLRLKIASAYDLSIDAAFCSLLNNARLRSIVDYLVAKGVPQSSIDTTTVKPANAAENDADEAESPTAQSSRTVFFVFAR